MGPKLVINSNGDSVWRLPDGKPHRDGAPAFISRRARVLMWFKNGEIHRTDGPAYINGNGYKEWWKHDKRHCEVGPAVFHKDGSCSWWLNNILITNENDISLCNGDPENIIYLKLKYGI